MNKLFGIPMTDVALALAAIVLIALLALAYAALRSPVLFRMGLRNIPRRRAQSALIVFGLMVSTMIITAAFTVGDSLSTSIHKTATDKLGPIDLSVRASRSLGADAGVSAPYISDAVVQSIEQQVGERPQILSWLPVIIEPAPATNPAAKLTEPRVQLVGLDPASVQRTGGLHTPSGRTVQVSDLGQNQVYINATAADKLNAKPGDTLFSLFANKPLSFTVKDVVQDTTLSGWAGVGNTFNGGVVMPLATMRGIAGKQGVNHLYLSTSTNAADGLKRSEQLWPVFKSVVESPSVSDQLAGSGVALKAVETKHDSVEQADLLGSAFTSFFLLIGLFSIAAGMMLIFLIFVMLAAERRSEMGMARAVGIKRGGLVQTFLAEGMAYNLAAGAVGAALGVGVATGIIWIATNLIFTGNQSLPLASSVSVRSLIVSYCLGVALTFITVVFSAYRTSRVNIVAAIRDLPEDGSVSTQRRRVRGRAILSSVLRLLGTVAVVAGLSSAAKSPAGLVIALAGLVILGVAAGLLHRGVWAVAWRIVASLPAGVPWAILGLFRAFGVSWAATWSVICLLVGVAWVLLSHGASSIFLFMGGVSLTLLGIALFSRTRGVMARPAFTLFGVAVLLFWLLPFKVLSGLFGDWYGNDPGGPEMFFLSGIMIVLGSTLVLVFNGELLARAVNRLGGWLGTLRPSLATAIAYPMASRLRTGMTLAMFSLIIFSITVMSTLNANFQSLFMSKDATGGWDIVAAVNLNNPIPDFKAALAQNGVDTSKIAAMGASTTPQALSDIRTAGTNDWQRLFVRAADNNFLQASTMKLQAHVRGDAPEGVWKELDAKPGTGIVSASVLGSNGPSGSDSPNFQLKGVKSNVKLLDKPVTVEVKTPSGQVTPVQVIGIIDQVVQGTQASMFVSDATYRQAIGTPNYSYYTIRLTPGTDDKVYAKQIKASMAQLGVDAESVRSQLEDNQRLSQGISYLFQGFMGLGLFVGVAAVGVIAARTVVERRQQIGMLRAVGYRRSQVALSFALESSFIALFGIVAGVVTAIILSYNLLNSDTFAENGSFSFTLPVAQIALFAGIAYVASLAMTWLPSRKAASLPVAEALRYE